ncbi:hypothetical protein CYMTET_10862 [Cymbomonas tetramitiformis]|uniref:Uncharacterized protein n=1 Tax=Cymbomonas tetramitiformis TaxID=36881 RepID=A0AAE0GPT8_9CHLO|nr:hypothetical protein CYMTET_10862 [Cymbomonas tetramitiformis]
MPRNVLHLDSGNVSCCEVWQSAGAAAVVGASRLAAWKAAAGCMCAPAMAQCELASAAAAAAGYEGAQDMYPGRPGSADVRCNWAESRRCALPAAPKKNHYSAPPAPPDESAPPAAPSDQQNPAEHP